MLKKKIFFIVALSFLIIKFPTKADVYIVTNIDGQIITNYDIEKESDYLIILNPSLSKLNKDEVLQISKQSLIREIIKKKEIKKTFDLSKENPFVNDYLKNLYTNG